jgi:hypothetical protein
MNGMLALAIISVVCTDNLNTGVVVMKSAQNGARTDHTGSLNRGSQARALPLMPIFQRLSRTTQLEFGLGVTAGVTEIKALPGPD